MHFVYILYSRSIDKYYVGETDDVDRRRLLHNIGHFKGSYTSQSSDWEIVLKVECKDRSQALAIENAIKKWKSREYIENLVKYPELMEKLKKKF